MLVCTCSIALSLSSATTSIERREMMDAAPIRPLADNCVHRESITYAITQSMVYFEAAQKDAEAAVKRFVSQTKLGLRGIKG